MKKLKLLHTLVLLNFFEKTLELVYVDEDLVDKLVNEYKNDIEAWADAEFAEDIGVELGNCNWMLVAGKVDTFEHRMINGKWTEKQMYWV